MDIYDGLDTNFSSNAGKCFTFLLLLLYSAAGKVTELWAKFITLISCFVIDEPPPFGSQLKKSMDLYEEIVTEEQQSREASYIEVSCLAHGTFLLKISCFCFDSLAVF